MLVTHVGMDVIKITVTSENCHHHNVINNGQSPNYWIELQSLKTFLDICGTNQPAENGCILITDIFKYKACTSHSVVTIIDYKL